MNRSAGEARSVKRFERSNGLDTALYKKNYLYLFYNQKHFNIKIKSDNTKVSRRRRNFRKGNYKEMRTILAHIDGNDKMKNKTGTESWNI